MASSDKVFQIFRAGLHTCMDGRTLEFGEQDLNFIAAAYSQSLRPAPLVLGHPQDDKPTYGEVSGVFCRDGKLFACARPHADLVKLVQAGCYKYVSASFMPPNHPNNPNPGTYYLRHVGFLGAHPPAVKGMTPPAFGEPTGTLSFAEGYEAPSLHAGYLCVPSGWHVSEDNMRLYNAAEEVRNACPSLSYAEAVQMAETFIRS